MKQIKRERKSSFFFRKKNVKNKIKKMTIDHQLTPLHLLSLINSIENQLFVEDPAFSFPLHSSNLLTEWSALKEILLGMEAQNVKKNFFLPLLFLIIIDTKETRE
jgi:hypothetical protein